MEDEFFYSLYHLFLNFYTMNEKKPQDQDYQNPSFSQACEKIDQQNRLKHAKELSPKEVDQVSRGISTSVNILIADTH